MKIYTISTCKALLRGGEEHTLILCFDSFPQLVGPCKHLQNVSADPLLPGHSTHTLRWVPESLQPHSATVHFLLDVNSEGKDTIVSLSTQLYCAVCEVDRISLPDVVLHRGDKQ